MFLEDDRIVRVKQIKEGKAQIEPHFSELAQFVSSNYNVSVIDVFHQTDPNDGIFFVVNSNREKEFFFDFRGLKKELQVEIREAALKIENDKLREIMKIAGLYFSFDDFETSEIQGIISKILDNENLADNFIFKCKFINGMDFIVCLYPTDADFYSAKENGNNQAVCSELKAIASKYDEYKVLTDIPLIFDSEENYNKYSPRIYFHDGCWQKQ